MQGERQVCISAGQEMNPQKVDRFLLWYPSKLYMFSITEKLGGQNEAQTVDGPTGFPECHKLPPKKYQKKALADE